MSQTAGDQTIVHASVDKLHCIGIEPFNARFTQNFEFSGFRKAVGAKVIPGEKKAQQSLAYLTRFYVFYIDE